MFQRSQLKKEAVRLRRRIQGNRTRAAVCSAYLRVRALELLGTPMAVAAAFAAGVIVDRLGFPAVATVDRVNQLVRMLFRISRIATFLRRP